MSNTFETSLNLKRTALFETHTSLKGHMVSFTGWELPAYYSSARKEVRAVRKTAGLFDTSHRAKLRFSGSDAAFFLNRFLSKKVPELDIGQGQYQIICNEVGGIIDDAVLYRLGEARFLLLVNASSVKDVLNLVAPYLNNAGNVTLENLTDQYTMISFQGPQAVDILEDVTPADLQRLKPYRCVEPFVVGNDVLLSRTGYTGEDGFELIFSNKDAESIWTLLMGRGGMACGLLSRDILRLESGLLLHGNDIDITVNPFEAKLDEFIELDKEDYIAGAALQQIRNKGISRTIIGLTLKEREIARRSYEIMYKKKPIGKVTSGTFSPTIEESICLGYVPLEYALPGTKLQIKIKDVLVNARVVALPFYSKVEKV